MARYFAPYPYAGPAYYGNQMSIRTVMIITIVVILFIFGIYWYMRKKILSSVEDELPSATTGVNYTPQEDTQIRYLAIAMKDDLSRYVQMGHDLSIYKELLTTSDKVFSGIARYYKQLAGESLRQSLTDSSSSFSINLTDGTFGESSEVHASIINRLNALKLV